MMPNISSACFASSSDTEDSIDSLSFIAGSNGTLYQK
jgi:hypothetical protein